MTIGSEIDMDAVVKVLRRRGIYAYVEHTGGGCATIYAGGTTTDENGDERYDALAGPGWFVEGPSGRVRYARADASDFYVGMDDDGDTLPQRVTITDPEAIADAIMAVPSRV